MSMSDPWRTASRRQFLAAGAAGVGLKGTPALAEAALKAHPAIGPIIVNALGGLENPNLELARQTPALPDSTVLGVDDRAVLDALASGVTAVNITLGYVAGPMEPFDYTGQVDRSLGPSDPAAI